MNHTGPRENISPAVTAQLIEMEHDLGWVFEFRFGHVAVSTVRRSDGTEGEPVECDARGGIDGLFPDDESSEPMRVVDGEWIIGQASFHKAWTVRVRMPEDGKSTAFGWPAPTAQACAEFLIADLARADADAPL